jgi:hypothetical protein
VEGPGEGAGPAEEALGQGEDERTHTAGQVRERRYGTELCDRTRRRVMGVGALLLIAV